MARARLRAGCVRRSSDRSRGGFTLIELLVVISIITIIATATIMLVSGLLKGASVKEAGRVVQMAFAKGRQVASTKRMMHFLTFDFSGNFMTIYEDTNRDKRFDKSTDKMSGEAISLPPTVYFDKVFDRTTGTPYAAFQPDGSVVFYQNMGSTAVADDISWSSPPNVYAEGSESPPGKSDIVMRLGEDPVNAPDKVFCDVVGLTGLMRKMEYMHKADGVTWP